MGPAFTLRFVPAREDLATPASWASPISTRAAIEAMPEGCIAVVDALGVTDAGIFGDILCARMKKRGVAGLVTIEDILEEIVGEISDEYDRDTTGIEPLGDGRLRVPAGMAIDDLADLFAVGIDEDEVDTVGGLLTKAIGQVPQPGSRAEVAGLLLTAERMAGRRHRLATVLVEPVSTSASPRRTEGDLDA